MAMRKLRQRQFPAPVLAAAALLALLCAHPAAAQSGPPADLDEYVARAMKTFGVPGLSVAIVKDGKVVAAKGYGVRCTTRTFRTR